MSILMMSQVWALENLEPAEKLVLLAIADFADDQGQAWPSIPTLARKSSLSEDTVRRKIRKISTDGILSISPRKDKTGRDTSYNFQLFPETSSFVALFREKIKLSPETSPEFSILGEGSTVPPLQPARVEGSTVQGGGLQGATLILETSFKHQKEPSKMFDQFWSAYPRKTGKALALKIWQRLNPSLDTVTAILTSLEWQRQQPDWQKAAGRFIPHPSTWLNGSRWEDERPATAASACCAATHGSTTLEDLRAKGIDV